MKRTAAHGGPARAGLGTGAVAMLVAIPGWPPALEDVTGTFRPWTPAWTRWVADRSLFGGQAEWQSACWRIEVEAGMEAWGRFVVQLTKYKWRHVTARLDSYRYQPPTFNSHLHAVLGATWESFVGGQGIPYHRPPLHEYTHPHLVNLGDVYLNA